IVLINHGTEPFTVTRAMRIAQLVVAPTMRARLIEVAQLAPTVRGAGGVGSTRGPDQGNEGQPFGGKAYTELDTWTPVSSKENSTEQELLDRFLIHPNRKTVLAAPDSFSSFAANLPQMKEG